MDSVLIVLHVLALWGLRSMVGMNGMPVLQRVQELCAHFGVSGVPVFRTCAYTCHFLNSQVWVWFVVCAY